MHTSAFDPQRTSILNVRELEPLPAMVAASSMPMRRTRSEWVNSEISVARASLSLTCEVLGWRVRSFLNLSGKQPLCHFEIGFSYLWNVGMPSTLNKLSCFNEIVH